MQEKGYGDILYFRYKPVSHFLESEYYTIDYIGDKAEWSTLEYFEITDKGYDEFQIDYLHIEMQYDILEQELETGFFYNNNFGIEIVEHNGDLNFYEIPMDAIEIIYTKEDYPEYYL